MLKFGGVGCINTAVDWTTYFLLLSLFPISSPLVLTMMKILSGTTAMLNSFWFNRRYTFQKQDHWPSRFVKFTLTHVINLTVTGLVFYLLISLNAVHFIALIGSAGVGFLFNFALNNNWVFAEKTWRVRQFQSPAFREVGD